LFVRGKKTRKLIAVYDLDDKRFELID